MSVTGDRQQEARPFRTVAAVGSDWKSIGQQLVEQIRRGPAPVAGILYVCDVVGDDLGSLLTLLRQLTGVEVWSGCTGIGIMAGDRDYFDQPAAVALLAHVEAGLMIPFNHRHGPPRSPLGNIALLHANPAHADASEMIPELAATRELFLVGGMASARGRLWHFSGDQPQDGPFSGLWLDPQLGIATGLSQGCTPIGPAHTVDVGGGTVIERLDGRPALDVLKEEVGDILSRDLRRIAGYILAALPVAGSDTGDYLVRNIMALDPQTGRIAIGGHVGPGDQVLFVRRDHGAAIEDLERMVKDVKRRAGGPLTGALYISCLGRGPNMVADGRTEPGIVRDLLGGDVPLVGFYANGEISNDRLYGYTGVLTVFTGG